MRALSMLYMQFNKFNGVPIPVLTEASQSSGWFGGYRCAHCAGSLPASWSQMPVQELNLMNNTLSGSLPPSWGSAASNLTSLSLSQNHITGAVMHLRAHLGCCV